MLPEPIPLRLDEQLIRAFLEALTGNADPDVHWQVFDDSKAKRPELARCWFGRLDIDVLQLHQEQGCGVFIAINETDGIRRLASSITRVRSCFCDNDGVVITPALTPSFWTITARGENPFWLATGPVDEFSYVQARLARFYSTDKAVKDPSRVMRVPGTWHLKAEPRLVGFRPGSGLSHTFAEILAAHNLPEPAPPNTKRFRLVRSGKAWIESRAKLVRQRAGERTWAEGYRHQSLLETLTHARRFWLPEDHIRSIAYEYGSPAGLPDREIEKVYEWVLASVDPNPEDDPSRRAVQNEEDPEPEQLPDELARIYTEIFETESPTLREQKIKEASKRFSVSVLTIKKELQSMQARQAGGQVEHEPWYVDLSGLPWHGCWKGVFGAKLLPGGMTEIQWNDVVATRPIWPAALGRDIVTGNPYILLKWFNQYEAEESRWFLQTSLRDRDVIRSIPGACIGASRVNKLSDYLADAEARVKDRDRKLTSHYGWVGDSWIWAGADGGPEYLGDPLPNPGPLEKWRRGVDHLLTLGEAGYPALVCLAASAGSPLVRLAGRRNPILALACQTSTGKGTAINYALSLWTDPGLLTLPASSTIKGAQDRAMLLPDAPLFADEIHQLDEEDLHRLLYFLGNGQRRVTSTIHQKAVGGQRRWGFGFAAAEMDLLAGGHGGIGTRVIELRDKPLPDAASAAILRTATRHHGAAAARLSAILTANSVSLLDDAVAMVRRRSTELHGDDENALAVIWAGAWLLAESLGLEQGWIKPCLEWLISFHCEGRRSHIDKFKAAWEDIVDTVQSGQRNDDGSVWVANERIGWLENPIGTFDFLPRHPRIVQILTQAGGAYRVLAAFADRGWILRGEGSNLKTRRRIGVELARVIRASVGGNT